MHILEKNMIKDIIPFDEMCSVLNCQTMYAFQVQKS